MKKKIARLGILLFLFPFGVVSQTLDEARTMYRAGEYAEALPVFEKNLKKKPKNPSLNQWYGVCLYETGDHAGAEKYLKIAAAGKIPTAYRYLGDIYFEQYRFDEAAKYYTYYTEYLEESDDEDENEDSEYYELRSAQAETGMQKLSKVQAVTVIDSLVADKVDFFRHYRLSAESGSLHDYAALFGEKIGDASPVYLTQRGDKTVYAVPNEDNGYELVVRMRSGSDTFGEAEPIEDLNTSYNENYPFLLSDGTTLYFASDDEDESLGGYDIFKTSYDRYTEDYDEPEALPLPFNSPYNDYLLAIDENMGVGWFASDRFQPEGKVVIYIFLWEEKPEYLAVEDSPELLRRARLASIRETQTADADYTKIIEQIRRIPTERPAANSNEIYFIVSDGIVYTDLSQFRSEQARKHFLKAQEIRKSITAQENELQRLRKKYAAGTDRTATAARIETLEKKLEALYPQPEAHEMQSRAAELSEQHK